MTDQTESTRCERSWSPPQVFRAAEPTDQAAMKELLGSGKVRNIIDPIEVLGDELYDLRRMGDLADEAARCAFMEKFLVAGESFGSWVFLPWSGELVRYPDRDEHRNLRTFRNRDLITLAEQSRFQAARIAVFGLSVGSNLVDQFVQLGIGTAYLIADPDHLSASNLNRLRTSMRHVGMRKIDVVAQKISEADPWIEQVHVGEGYTPAVDPILDRFKPTLILEEVDDLVSKARLRHWAHQHQVPLLMAGDIGEKAVLDVERHDIHEVKPFNGRLKPSDFDRLRSGALDQDEVRRLLIKVVGPRHLSVRLIESAAKVGTELAGLPQLGSTASVGAALASIAAREILTGGNVKSGAYAMKPRKILKLNRQSSLRQALEAIGTLRKHQSSTAGQGRV